MRLFKFVFIPIFILSLVIIILNFNKNELQNFSFLSVLEKFDSYSNSSNINFLERIKNDLYVLNSNVSHNPLYESRDVTSEPNIIDYFNYSEDFSFQNKNFFEKFKQFFSDFFQLVRDTVYYKTGNEPRILSLFSSIANYVDFAFNWFSSFLSLIIDSFGLCIQFVFFSFDILFL